MAVQVIDQKELARIIRILGTCELPRKAAVNIALQLQSWEKHRGLKWVVNRLKLYQSHFKVNGTKAKCNLRLPLGIKLHKDGSFHGCFRALWILASRGRRGMGKALVALNITGRWKAPTPVESQYVEFRDSIDVRVPYHVPEVFISPEDKWLALQEAKRAQFNLHLSTSESSYSPFFGSFAKRSILDPEDHARDLEQCPALVLKHYSFLSSLFALMPSDHYEMISYQRTGFPDIVGGVKGLTKDRSLKVRFIANPNLILQAALSRLQSAIDGFLQCLPESCVHNQDKSLKWIQRKLRKGYSLSSVDLSKCSDNLPATEQFTLLRQLFDPHLQDDIDLFEDVSRSSWFCPYPPVKLRWTKGQPLGTNPSFASFTVFHLMVIRACGGDASNFRVIGDDVVFADNVVARRVKRAYKLMGVEININKSIIKSKRWAEFAGRLVDVYGPLPQYKGAPLSVVKDPLGYIRQYGIKGIKLIPRRYRPMLYGIAMLPRPYGFGHERLFDELNPRLVYELLTPRFKPRQYARAPEAILAWRSAFRAGIRPLPALPDGSHESTQTLLGESIGVSSTSSEYFEEDELKLVNHVQSWHDTPLEDLPSYIRAYDEYLTKQEKVQDASKTKEAEKARYRKEAYQPISYLKRLWARVCKYFADE